MKSVKIAFESDAYNKKIFKVYKNKLILSRILDIKYKKTKSKCIKCYLKYGKQTFLILPKDNNFVKNDKISLLLPSRRIITVDILKTEEVDGKIAEVNINDDEKLLLKLYGAIYAIEQDIDKDKSTEEEVKVEKSEVEIDKVKEEKTDENKIDEDKSVEEEVKDEKETQEEPKKSKRKGRPKKKQKQEEDEVEE